MPLWDGNLYVCITLLCISLKECDLFVPYSLCVSLSLLFTYICLQWVLFYVELAGRNVHIYEGNEDPSRTRRVSDSDTRMQT